MPSTRFAEQFHAIAERLNSDRMSAPPIRLAPGPSGTGPADPPCVIQRGTLLMSSDDADLLIEISSTDDDLRILNPRFQDGDRAERSGLVRVSVGTTDQAGPQDDDYQTPDDDVAGALQRLQFMAAGGGPSIVASPNHVIGISNATICPADEPWPTRDPRSIREVQPAPLSHRKPRVLIIDTGLLANYGLLYLGDDIDGANRKDETVHEHGYDFIREYVGHGTFIAGLLKATAPTAHIYVSNALPHLGASFEDEFGESLFAAVKMFQQSLPEGHQHAWPDIISLSAGTTLYYDPNTHPQPHEQGLLALKTFMDKLKEKRTLLVAAAGNNGSSIRFYPAALAERQEFSDAVVSVGALREKPGDGRTCFSDFGPWVKAFAPGERLVSGFSAPAGRKLKYQHKTFEQCQFLAPPDNYPCTCQYPRHEGVLSSPPPPPMLTPGYLADFSTWSDARWSGTSFATPLVAGYIAQRMAHENRDDARAVYADMLKTGATIQVEGETALKVVPHGFKVQPMALFPDAHPAPGD